MSGYDNSTRLFPVQKTLRFEARPVGSTWKNLSGSGLLESDGYRAEQYKTMKSMIDDYHRHFIEESLSNVNLDWAPLAESFREKKTKGDDQANKTLDVQLDKYRKTMLGCFKADVRFEHLFDEKLFSKLMKPVVESEGTPEEREAFEAFKRFAGYFTGFHESRRNIYAPEKKSTSAISRIIDDNFPKFLENSEKYERIKKERPGIIDKLRTEIGEDPDPYFLVENYNRFLSQSGIDSYNYVLSGKTLEAGKRSVQGLNVLLNLEHQQDKGFRLRMTPLYNQILGQRVSRSYIPRQFENDAEVCKAISDYQTEIKKNASVEAAGELIRGMPNFDTYRIYVLHSKLGTFSNCVFERWDTAENMLRAYYAYKLGDPNMEKTEKKIDGMLNKKSGFKIGEIAAAAEYVKVPLDFKKIDDALSGIIEKISENEPAVGGLRNMKISNDEENISAVKNALDPYMDLVKFLRMFAAGDDEDRDENFYSEFDEAYETLFGIVPLYNKVRNYCTKSRFDKSKIRLKLGNPTLADGWDLNKERDNTAVILRKDGLYYLGIMNPEKKIDFADLGDDGGEYFEKMEYKLLPGPNKMLPKVFFSKKNIGYYAPSKYIMDGYEAKKHLKSSDNFDLKFCHDLIDFFKASIARHPDWKNFGFEFSPTSSYNDITGFYKEIEKQGYKVRFRRISATIVRELVDEGRLYLFQIYNKDFSPKSKGTPNMHTLYWRAAFSDENLKDPIIKLNGEAELFFRKKTDGTFPTHKKGSVLVNRTVGKDVKTPMTDEIYYELFRYKTGQIPTLSERAKKYEACITTKIADRDLVKDRRYSVDKILFHVPMTINFGVDDTSKDLNKRILSDIMTSDDFKVIGIDRGERNLLYYSMIGLDGNIEEQGSLNVIDGYDYHAKLGQREYENKKSRQDWTKVGQIKQLKEGYLSQAVNKIVKMAVENHAIIVLEDLNYGFKRGRFKVEKQVYQKFENMLISKLACLVYKKRDPMSPGGVMNAYQLAKPPESVKNPGKQNGIVFYIPAAYTSKIDPTTGFVNMFSMSALTNNASRRKFIQDLNSIAYDSSESSYVFTFDYRKFATKKDHRNVWSVYTRGERITYSRTERKHNYLHPTEIMREALGRAGIGTDGNLKETIAKADDKTVKEVIRALGLTLQMRNEDEKVDYIISPVRNGNGDFFCTLDGKKGLPLDSDANGAYCIALKGELLLRMSKEKYDPTAKYPKLAKIDNISWLTYMQSGRKIWKNRSRYPTSTTSCSARSPSTTTT